MSFFNRPFVYLEQAEPSATRAALSQNYQVDEDSIVHTLLNELTDYDSQKIEPLAISIVQDVRKQKQHQSPLDAFMQEYDLSSDEGVMLMCIAEALLRIPDAQTAEELIRDKLSDADWGEHLGQSESLFVNASTWGLMLTGKIVQFSGNTTQDLSARLNKLIGKSSEPVIRLAIRQAMKIMGHQFVMGKNIQSALKRSQKNPDYRHSFDMLGESALTYQDADRYFEAYHRALDALANQNANTDLFSADSISIKLSALHPRLEFTHHNQLLDELGPRLADLCLSAQSKGVPVTIDTEEADRLDLTLDLFEYICHQDGLKDWHGLGIAVQAYQKRGLSLLNCLAELARKQNRKIPVRLVKGAYWDSEIKHAQELGLNDYPVFTRKPNSDVSYLACAKFLLAHRNLFYPQFATHNAHSIAAVYILAGNNEGYEYQRLHGMGEMLYQAVVPKSALDVPCRIYAPVGSHEDLLPYLVRRLLENGSNTSFVNRIVDEKLPAESVVADPVDLVRTHTQHHNPHIPLPEDIFGAERKNATGLTLASATVRTALKAKLEAHSHEIQRVKPLIPGCESHGSLTPIHSPLNHQTILGEWQEADEPALHQAFKNAQSAQEAWDQLGFEKRADCLDKTADLIQAQQDLFIRLCVDEAGKTIDDSIAEVREAVDFCRYYAAQARKPEFKPQTLPGPTGESNQLSLHGRGCFVCISPWNFPLAIFAGQIAAALVCGNAVLAKPAEQTNMVAYHAVKCFHQAGIPEQVLQLVPGMGRTVGHFLSSHPTVAGVAFTGSTETARLINRSLANRDAPIATVVAETGGQNAMLVDSSALPEQVVKDVMLSAFGSSGQRCSALRVLFLQEEIADNVCELLKGAMQTLKGGDPALLDTDYGPVIDETAQQVLLKHIEKMKTEHTLLAVAPEPDCFNQGYSVLPHAFEIPSIDILEREVFGPILHIVRYKGSELNQVIQSVNATGYGLTLGVHTRIEQKYYAIQRQCHAGNCYINRNMIGAMVGVQPFGGEGLSGTGPKAGGPHYLYRFTTERTLTINTAAIGGNATLLTLEN